MLDRPLIRRAPPSKIEDDGWMLDRWTPTTAHASKSVYREVKDREGRVVERVYRRVCSCGWRSIEYYNVTNEPCPVVGALVERANRMRKDGERIEWRDIP